MNNRILEKIKKCLRLAQSDNAAEAAAALRQAQKLMAMHGLSNSDVELADVEKHRAKSVRSANPPEWVWYLMHTISRAFGVEFINHVRRGPDTSWNYQSHTDFIGVGSNPQVASDAFSVLFRRLCKDRSSHLDSLPSRLKRSTRTRRADLFAQAWVDAVNSKVVAIAMPVSTRHWSNAGRNSTTVPTASRPPKTVRMTHA